MVGRNDFQVDGCAEVALGCWEQIGTRTYTILLRLSVIHFRILMADPMDLHHFHWIESKFELFTERLHITPEYIMTESNSILLSVNRSHSRHARQPASQEQRSI